MYSEFKPFFRNSHLATIAGNFWSRPKPTDDYKAIRTVYRLDNSNSIVCFEQYPIGKAVGHILFLHGLEGSSEAGYIRSFASSALEKGFAVHRLNFRTCGGTEDLSSTMYHSGLSIDAELVIRGIAKLTCLPMFLVGFSLGGNIALKVTGELAGDSQLAGTIAVSAPIDLAVCVRAIDRLSNRIYAHRFVSRLKSRIRRKSEQSPDFYKSEFLKTVRTIWQFDNIYTAPLFGFGNAANYYATQSAINYVREIRSPTLIISAKNDPLVPYVIYQHDDIRNNPAIELISPEYGGHIGFLSRKQPRFWVDHVALSWIQKLVCA